MKTFAFCLIVAVSLSLSGCIIVIEQAKDPKPATATASDKK